MNHGLNKHTFALFYKNLSVNDSSSHVDIRDTELCQRIVKVLRLRINSQVILFNDQINVLVELTAFLSHKVECKILNFNQNQNLLPEIVLAVGCTRAAVFEQIVYQASSQGVGTVLQVQTTKSLAEKSQQNSERLEKVATSAREQSKSFCAINIDQILPIEKLDETYDFTNYQTLVFDANGIGFGSLQIENNKPFLLILGAQEGFTNDEIQLLVEKGAQKVTLGKTILKTEIACAVATGLVRALIESDLSAVD